jgi:hypothetical protein
VIEVAEWKAYFADTGLQPIQYKLLGTNAHLNGGLWQALTHSFTQEEMQRLKKEFVIFKKSLNHTYVIVYKEAIVDNKKAKLLHQSTLARQLVSVQMEKKTNEAGKLLLEWLAKIQKTAGKS